MPDTEIIDAEIVEDMMTYAEALGGMNDLAADAEDINARIERYAAKAANLWARGAWKPLGHKTWAECVEARGAQLRLPRADRRELVALLDSAGMTTRAIAPVVGASYDTVQRDIRGDRNLSPATPAGPRTKTGLDGKTYTIPPRPTAPANVDPRTGEVIDADALARRANAEDDAAWLTATLTRVSLLDHPNARARHIEARTQYADREDPFFIDNNNPTAIRHLADVLTALANEMEQADA